MTATAGVGSRDRATFLPAVLAAGATAGVLDITAAFVQSGVRGVAPAAVLRYIASGLLGRSAFAGGTGAAALGLLMHFAIATGWAALFHAAGRRFPALVERPFVAGPLYGILVCVLMYHVAVPLSAVPPSSATPTLANLAMRYVIHVFCVGVPIALVTSRFARRGEAVGYGTLVAARD